MYVCEASLGSPREGAEVLLRSECPMTTRKAALDDCHGAMWGYLRHKADWVGPDGLYDTAEDAMEHICFLVTSAS